MKEVGRRGKKRVTPKFLAWETAWMVVSFTQSGNTGGGTGLVGKLWLLSGHAELQIPLGYPRRKYRAKYTRKCRKPNDNNFC